MKSANHNFLEPSGPIQACNWTALPLLLPLLYILIVAICMFRVGVDIVAYEDVSFCTQYVSCENILKYGTPMWNTLYMNLSFPFQKLPVTETVTKFHVSMTDLVFIIIIIQGDYCTKFHVSMTFPLFIIIIIQGDYCTFILM
jgi:hypothetical protein